MIKKILVFLCNIFFFLPHDSNKRREKKVFSMFINKELLLVDGIRKDEDEG